MSVNTPDKRRVVLWVYPVPGSGIGEEDRRAVLWQYPFGTDIVLHPKGGNEISVNQPPHGAASDYPFVNASDDLGRLLGEAFLSFEDPTCRFAYPLNIAWMAGFGSDPSVNPPGFPTPVHARDVLITDANGVRVFDSTQATDFVEVAWAGRLATFEWTAPTAVLRITQHTASKPDHPPLSYPTFIVPTNGEMDSRTYQRVPPRVKSFKVGLVTVQAENVIWGEGFNFSMEPQEVVSDDGGRRVQSIAITADPGDGLGRLPSCEEADPPIRRINGIQPDDAGNFVLDADGCYRIQRPTELTNTSPREVTLRDSGLTDAQAAAALKIFNDCGPCCECDDFVNTYQGLKKLDERYHGLGTRAEGARDQYALNLARWQSARSCYLGSPFRMVVEQEFGCTIAFGMNFCNLNAVCINDVIIRLTLEGFKDGVVDPSMSAIVAVCPETVKNTTGTKYEDLVYNFDGAYPVLDTPIEVADPQATQKIRTRFSLAGCTNGQTLCITATAHYVGGETAEIPLPSDLETIWTGAGITPTPIRGLLKKCVALSPESQCR